MTRRIAVAIVCVATSLLAAAGSAQALVVDMNAVGHTTVPYSASDRAGYDGVALVPGTCSDLADAGTCAGLAAKAIPTVTSQGPCTDPALAPDLILPNTGICSHGGEVVASNETFALTWDAHRAYWAGTRGYVEQFLRDVADGSGSLGSPYAVPTQYTGPNGRAQNNSKYGGGCIDYGAAGGSACEFATASEAGHDYPANGCTVTGDSFLDVGTVNANTVCLTDAQVQSELATMIDQTGVLGRTQPGYKPVVTLLMPAGVETCMDAAAKLCSINGNLTPPPVTIDPSGTGGLPPGTYQVKTTYLTRTGEDLPGAAQTVTAGAGSSITIESPVPAPGAIGWYAYVAGPGPGPYQRVVRSVSPIGSPITVSGLPQTAVAPPHTPFYCSYHSQVSVGGTEVAYVVQPWSAFTACDEPDAPPVPPNPSPQQLAVAVGLRLVSPLSQSQIATIVNPNLDGWYALDGSEINDNHGCVPLANGLDSVTVGSSAQNPYLLQREFNNAGVIETDPNTYFGCAPGVLLAPAFVVPSSVNQGDVIQFDGSATASTLIVPNTGYRWDFGDGTTATGPSVVHSYATTGTYAVKLTVTDRGGNVRTLTQTIDVLGPNGEPPVTATGPGAGTGAGAGPGSATTSPTAGGSPTAGAPAPHPRPRLQVRLQLMPQALKGVLRSGMTVVVVSNERADGLASLSIPRSAAKRAHLKTGRGPSVVIGQGTVSGIASGKTTLHLRLSRSVASKLKALHHVVLTVRMTLIATGGQRAAIDVAGHY
jgi:hypothetical protein